MTQSLGDGTAFHTWVDVLRQQSSAKPNQHENDATFLDIASRRYAFQILNWVCWRTNSALYLSFDNSPSDRDSFSFPDSEGPYFFNYILNRYEADADGNNPSMSSIIASGTPAAKSFKETRVRNPAKKIMLEEESDSLNKRSRRAAWFWPPLVKQALRNSFRFLFE